MASYLLPKSMLFGSSLPKIKKKMKSVKKSVCEETDELILCRICVKDKGNIPIFNNVIYPHIPEDIKHFSGVTMTTEDNMSQYMCQDCLDLLKGCIMFRDLCRINNKRLQDVCFKKEQNCYEDVDEDNTQDSSEDYSKVPSPTYLKQEPENWKCSYCDKQFLNSRSYKRHLTVYHKQTKDIKPAEKVKRKLNYLCDICGKIAFSRPTLHAHRLIHQNVFPFKCDVCPYRGRTLDLLKVHKRSHLVEKPFKCPHCEKTASTSSNLAKHVRQVHSSSRPYKCNYCDKGFSYEYVMRRHVKDIHLRQGTVDCDVCFKKFNTKKILQGHRAKIHKIKGDRLGRLPSYLQCRVEENTNECETFETPVQDC